MFTWNRNFVLLVALAASPSLLSKDPIQKRMDQVQRAREKGMEAVRERQEDIARAREKGMEAVRERQEDMARAREKAQREIQQEREKRGYSTPLFSPSASPSWAKENQRINELNRQEEQRINAYNRQQLEARFESEFRGARAASERPRQFPSGQSSRIGQSYTVDEFGNSVPYHEPRYLTPRPQHAAEEDFRPSPLVDSGYRRTTLPRPPGSGWNEVHDGHGGRTTRYGDHDIAEWMEWFRITANGLEYEPKQKPASALTQNAPDPTGFRKRFQNRAQLWKSRTTQWEKTASADYLNWVNREQGKLADETRPLISGAVTGAWQTQLAPYAGFWTSARAEFASIEALWTSLVTEVDTLSRQPDWRQKLSEKEASTETESEARFARVVAGWEKANSPQPALQERWKNLVALNDIVTEKAAEFTEFQKLIDQTVETYQKSHEKWWAAWHDDKYVVRNQEWLARKEKEGKALTLETREIIRASVKEKWENAHEEVSGALARMGRALKQEELDHKDFLKSVPARVKDWFLAGKKLAQVKESLAQLTQDEDNRRIKSHEAIKAIWIGSDPEKPLLENPWKGLVLMADLLMETSDSFSGFKKLMEETTKKYETDHKKWWMDWNDDKYIVRNAEWLSRKEKESRILSLETREHIRVPAKKKWELAQQEISGSLARMGRALQQEDLDQAAFLKKVSETVREQFLVGKKLPLVMAAVQELTEAEDTRRAKARDVIEGIWIGPDKTNPFFDKQWARTISASELIELESQPSASAIGKTNFQLRKELTGPTIKDSLAYVSDPAMKTSVPLFEWEGRKSFHSVGDEAVFIVESARLLKAKVKDERIAALAKAMEQRDPRGWAIWVNRDEIVDIIQPFAKTVQHLKVRADEREEHFLIYEGDLEGTYLGDVLGFELSILKLVTKRVPFSKYKLPTDKEFWEITVP